MPQASTAPFTGRPHVRRAACRGRRSFAAYYRWVDDALRHRTDGYRLLDSPLDGLPGVQRLAHRRFRHSAFADVDATRELLRQAIEQASAILTQRQALVLQLFCDGQPMVVLAARLGLRSHQHLCAAYLVRRWRR